MKEKVTEYIKNNIGQPEIVKKAIKFYSHILLTLIGFMIILSILFQSYSYVNRRIDIQIEKKRIEIIGETIKNHPEYNEYLKVKG